MAASLGPVVGGALTNYASWRWCFYLNRELISQSRNKPFSHPFVDKLKKVWLTLNHLIPFALVPVSGLVFLVVALALKVPTPKTPLAAGLKAIDWMGSLTITGGTLMILLGMQLGGSFHPWGSATVISLLSFGAVTLILFGLVEKALARYPILPLHLFSNRSNVGVLLVDFIHGIIFTQCAYFLPLYFQSALGASPLLGGVWLLPCATGLSLSVMAAGIYIKKTGRYLDPIRIGFVLASLGTGLFYILPETKQWPQIMTFQIIAGAGIGANMQPPLIALQGNVPTQYNAAATSSFGLVRNVASATAVVVGSATFSNKMASQRDQLSQVLGESTAGLLSGQESQGHLFIIRTLEGAQLQAACHALYEATRSIWVETACFAVSGLLCSLLISRKSLRRSTKRSRLAWRERRRERRSRRVSRQTNTTVLASLHRLSPTKKRLKAQSIELARQTIARAPILNLRIITKSEIFM